MFLSIAYWKQMETKILNQKELRELKIKKKDDIRFIGLK